MIRILHAADLHLDSPFAALDPAQAAQRRDEQRQLLLRLTEECDRRGCQLLLLAGDLFDSDLIYRETAELLVKTLGQLRAQVFIAPGNHDPWSPLSPYATLSWPENVHIFHSRCVEAIRIQDPPMTVYGAAFTDSREKGLLSGFTAEADGCPAIMVLHGVLGDPASVYNPISEEAVEASGLDYLALGHIHAASQCVIGGTTVVYPGCAMGRGFDELGEKGACYVELDDKGCRVIPVGLGSRRYEILRVKSGDDPLPAIQAALPEDTKQDIYRIILTGECFSPDLKALQETLRNRFYGLELADETRPPLSLWRDLRENSLKGEFLRQLKRSLDHDSSKETRRLVEEAAALGLAVMEGREVPEL